MSSFFQVTLDTTTRVGVEINGGNANTKNTTVTLELALDPDVELVKIWGTINPLDPANAGFGETEEGAEWLTPESVFLVNTTTNGGQKTLHVRVRDDVGNEATAFDSINLQVEGEVPPPPIQTPLPAGGAPEPKPRPDRRRVASGSNTGRIRGHASSVRSRPRQRGFGAGRIHSSNTIGSRAASESSQVTTRVQSSVRARRGAGTSMSRIRVSDATSVGRRDGANLVASLEELGIL